MTTQEILSTHTPQKDLDFRKTIQVYRDQWRGTDRVCRFTGKCINCQIRTFEFDDGENDPRGSLGDHANAALVAVEYGYEGPNVPCCFTCQNDTEEKYTRALNRAKNKWTNYMLANKSDNPDTVCPNCGQWQHGGRDCFNECKKRGFVSMIRNQKVN